MNSCIISISSQGFRFKDRIIFDKHEMTYKIMEDHGSLWNQIQPVPKRLFLALCPHPCSSEPGYSGYMCSPKWQAGYAGGYGGGWLENPPLGSAVFSLKPSFSWGLPAIHVVLIRIAKGKQSHVPRQLLGPHVWFHRRTIHKLIDWQLGHARSSL